MIDGEEKGYIPPAEWHILRETLCVTSVTSREDLFALYGARFVWEATIATWQRRLTREWYLSDRRRLRHAQAMLRNAEYQLNLLGE